jgi:hypothetical protein
MKKFFTLSFFVTSAAVFGQVRISQIYGGGGNATPVAATYNQDFVELFNAGSLAVTIGGWSVQYASAGGSTWAVAAIPAGSIIQPGGYYLVAMGNAGATGAALSTTATPDPIGTNTINLSGTSGKVALVNNTTALSGATTACSGATVIDVIGYGAGSCFETAVFPTTGITNALSAKRANNGCTDVNNNSTDFSLGAVLPRNSASPVSLCTSPTITAASNIAALTTNLGVASAPQSFNLSASNLTPAAADLTVTATAGLEISLSSTGPFTGSLTQPYTAGSLASTAIFVRIAASAPQGALSGANVTTTGGGATDAVITVAGGVFKNYYSKATGVLSDVSTWGDDPLGNVNPPMNFTTAFSLFNIVNRTSPATLGAPWDVTATGSKIIIGQNNSVITTPTDSIKATNFVELLDNSEIIIGNKVAPTFTTLGVGSNVEYTYAGTTTADTVKINNANYHNLALRNGLKYLKTGVTTVNGNLIIDGTANMNGAAAPFSTIVLKGNVEMLNNALIEDSSTANGFANRFTLNMAGNGVQNINTNTSELKLFRLQRDTAIGLLDVNLLVAPGSKITIGNGNGGDLKLTQKVAAGAPSFTTMTIGADAQIALVRSGFILADNRGRAGVFSTTNSTFIINKSVSSASNGPGTLRFIPGSTLKDLTLNIATATRDTLIIENNILVNNSLNLTKGFIYVAPGQTLELANAAIVNGGSASSHVDGNLKSTLNANETFLFPVGQKKQYSPIEITTMVANDFTVKYNKQVYTSTAINPVTAAAIPTYKVSPTEHWLISQGTANNADVKFYYNNPSSDITNAAVASIAHFNGTDWDDIGRTTNGVDANGTFISKNAITNFSPFTFGGANGVLPIALESFSGTLNNSTAALSWKTTCEDAGDVFELEYSTNGIVFENIYTTIAFGNCNGNLYKYNHTNANAPQNYYRLKLIAVSGRITYSNVVILKAAKNSFDVKLIATNNTVLLGLSITAPLNGRGTIQVVNLQGQIKYSKTMNYSNGNTLSFINTELWSKGLYFVNVINEDGVRNTLKFIK